MDSISCMSFYVVTSRYDKELNCRIAKHTPKLKWKGVNIIFISAFPRHPNLSTVWFSYYFPDRWSHLPIAGASLALTWNAYKYSHLHLQSQEGIRRENPWKFSIIFMSWVLDFVFLIIDFVCLEWDWIWVFHILVWNDCI